MRSKFIEIGGTWRGATILVHKLTGVETVVPELYNDVEEIPVEYVEELIEAVLKQLKNN